MLLLLLLPLPLLQHLLLLLCVVRSTGNFEFHTHMLTYDERGRERMGPRDRERESARFGGRLRLSLLRMCLEWSRGRAESTFAFMWLGEKAGQKGWQLQTHTHTLTHPHSLILTHTRVCGERHTFTRHMGASCKVKINPSIRAQKHNKHCAVANDVRGVLLNICSLYMYEHDSVLRIKYINLLDRT